MNSDTGCEASPIHCMCCLALLTLAVPGFVKRSDVDCDFLDAHLLIGE
jgi:hypothetical protein